MTWGKADPSLYPAARTPVEWLEAAFDSDYLRGKSASVNRSYMACIREDHLQDVCVPACTSGMDAARWPNDPVRTLRATELDSPLFRQLMEAV